MTRIWILLLLLAPHQARAAWEYQDRVDPMGRGTVWAATVWSENKVDFRPPYTSGQRAMLGIRSHATRGPDVMVAFDKAHFNCPIRDCTVLVRFDDGKAARFSVGRPSDSSTDTLFFHDHDRFVREALKAKLVRIEAEFFQDGTRVLEFNIAGLKWDMPTSKPAAKAAPKPAAAVAPSIESQQDRMRRCNGEMKDLRGDERKQAMSACLSRPQ